MSVETEQTQTTGQTESQTTGAGPNDQFLGIEPDLNAGETETESTDSPETEETEAESTEGGEGEEEATTEGEEGEEQTETEQESDETWLPDEQAKQFPIEVLADFAKRRGYGWTQQQIQNDAGLQKLLKDKLNADIYARDLEGQLNGTEGLDETTVEGEETEETPVEETTTTDTTTPDEPRKQYYQRVDQLVTKLDQAAVTELGKGLLDSMGVNTDTTKLEQMLANPKLTPDQRAEVQGALALAKNASKIGATIARGGVDLMMTLVPQLLPEMIESIFPGTQARFEAGVYAGAWQKVQGAIGKDQKPIYPSLPAYGSKEFQQLVTKAEKKLGLPENGLFNMVITDPKTGQPYPLQQQAIAKYRMVARSAGAGITPATVAAAVDTGRRQAEKVAQKRAAGRALGSGQTSRQFDQGGSEDAVLTDLRKQIMQHNQDDLPVSNLMGKK